VQQVAGELQEGMAAAGKADLVADYVLLLPLTLVSEILGVDERDRLRFRRWFTRWSLPARWAAPASACS
jgi:cytochrome P450